MSPALTEADDAASQGQAQARRQPPPSSFAQAGTGTNDQAGAEGTQNGGQKTFLQTRRRQPSSNNPKMLLGPRPIDLPPAYQR